MICMKDNGEKTDGKLLHVTNLETRDWYAWNDLMYGGGPPSFHLRGEVLVGNPGVEVLVFPRVPQGFNPNVLLVDLYLRQLPGYWTQNLVWAPAQYDKPNATYMQVEIFYENVQIVNTIPVNDIYRRT